MKQETQSKNEFAFNRMPLCSLVYFEAAKIMGFEERESMSLAHGRAVFFAAAKMGFKPKTTMIEETQHIIESVPFAGITAFCINTLEGLRCCTKSGDTIFTPDAYIKSEQRIQKAVGNEGLEFLRETIRQKLLTLGENINSKEVYKIYESNRDKLRRTSFFTQPILA